MRERQVHILDETNTEPLDVLGNLEIESSAIQLGESENHALEDSLPLIPDSVNHTGRHLKSETSELSFYPMA